MPTDLIYVAAACNRFNQAGDVSPSTSLIAFGSSSLVALWDLSSPDDNGVMKTLPDFKGSITCVKFLANEILIAANEAGMLNCWRKKSLDSEWTLTSTDQAHSASISTLSVQGARIVTGSSDSSIKIWKYTQGVDKDDIIESQTIQLKGKYPLISSMAYLPQTNVSILAVGGTDTFVRLWVCSDDEYLLSATLAGHEDWIRSLAFKSPGTEDAPLILASGSQDATIRLWNIEPWKKTTNSKDKIRSSEAIDVLLDTFEDSLGDLGENEEGGRQISLKHHILTVKVDSESSQQFSVTFDALLVGHEAGVTSLSWRRDISTIPTLLSTSTDSSVILWSPSSINSSIDASASIWINRQRFGDVGGQRLGGFVGGLWARDSLEVLAWGWAGGWRRWSCSSPTMVEPADEKWNEIGAISGHSGPIKGLDWSPDGKYIITTGLDQTTRIHGPVHNSANKTSWHEIARPQVHGYDLLNVVFVNPLKFASIADEKVVRVFEAPRGFVQLTEKLGVAQFSEEEHKRPVGANVPALGLSNKAISEELVGNVDLSRRPFEGELASITLWPETEKVFGHGYESITLGISSSRELIATACKSTSAEHAVVRVYDTKNYKTVGEPLHGHILTVTRIAFSPDDRHILTVSRDRSWRLFQVQQSGGYVPVAADKSHGRIIWDCAWSAEGDIFVTVSRDKTAKIWQQTDDSWKAVTTIKLAQPGTAVAIAPARDGKRRMAIGQENGEILIYSGITSSANWVHDETISSRVAHVTHIHRMAWRPSSQGSPEELATCSEDGTLRILIVRSGELDGSN
ncbi:Elongator complex protein 2 [Psilocybe cubensis]|uniref:Elongator complex protein 2 n=2 Tax=Psilocybe cubensis TaxID=181762 RepID=A0ACB8H5I5_PSICU|nr:Elongator complex protein 2 [Psilocybe cubensis]KAH9482449.1 Elongator complex protein 2 [Psilocybe cubensis]